MHSPLCTRYNRGLGRHSADCVCNSRRLDQVETGTCEGCGNQFEVGELAAIPAIDPDLRWCEACRVVCKCGHILGTHAVVVREGRSAVGCDGNHGEPGECDCQVFTADPPTEVVAAAKAIFPRAYAEHVDHFLAMISGGCDAL